MFSYRTLISKYPIKKNEHKKLIKSGNFNNNNNILEIIEKNLSLNQNDSFLLDHIFRSI